MNTEEKKKTLTFTLRANGFITCPEGKKRRQIAVKPAAMMWDSDIDALRIDSAKSYFIMSTTRASACRFIEAWVQEESCEIEVEDKYV